MRFTEYTMPERAPLDGLTGDDLRVLAVYNQIDKSNHFDVSNTTDQAEMLDDFTDSETFVVRGNDDEFIRGIAMYAPNTAPRTAEIVNLAVDAPYRGVGIGTFIVGSLVILARSQGVRTLEVVAADQPFWLHRGFEPTRAAINTGNTMMRLEL